MKSILCCCGRKNCPEGRSCEAALSRLDLTIQHWDQDWINRQWREIGAPKSFEPKESSEYNQIKKEREELEERHMKCSAWRHSTPPDPDK
jgi:hypothetical protein